MMAEAVTARGHAIRGSGLWSWRTRVSCLHNAPRRGNQLHGPRPGMANSRCTNTGSYRASARMASAWRAAPFEHRTIQWREGCRKRRARSSASSAATRLRSLRSADGTIFLPRCLEAHAGGEAVRSFRGKGACQVQHPRTRRTNPRLIAARPAKFDPASTMFTNFGRIRATFGKTRLKCHQPKRNHSSIAPKSPAGPT